MKKNLGLAAEFTLVLALAGLLAPFAGGGQGAGALAALAAGAVAGGILGNFVYRWVERSAEAAQQFATGSPDDGVLPVNHHLGRAIRDAQLSATIAVSLAVLAQLYATTSRWNPAGRQERRCLRQFVRQVRRWARRARCEWNANCEPEAVRLIAALLVDLVAMDVAGELPFAMSLGSWRRAAALTVAEMRDAGITSMPDAFVDAMHHPTGPISWRGAVKGFFLETLKTNDSVFRVVMLQLELAMLRLATRRLPARRMQMLIESEPADPRPPLTLPPLAADEGA